MRIPFVKDRVIVQARGGIETPGIIIGISPVLDNVVNVKVDGKAEVVHACWSEKKPARTFSATWPSCWPQESNENTA